MKKFKTIFYTIYICYFLFSAFVAFYYEDIVLRWAWDPIDTWTGLIRFVLKMGAIGSVLFITEIIIENIHLFVKRREIKVLNIEVLSLKSKLYDQSAPEPNQATKAPQLATPAEEPAPTKPEEDNSSEKEENG